MPSIAQVTGADASLANMIVSAARNATTHQKNCEQLAGHVKLIGNLVEKLKCSDLMKLPATKEPLDGMEEALRKALDLVESCKDKSYLYMLAFGWNVVYHFKQVQAEIDWYLKLVPLISLVHEFRMQNIKEVLEVIEVDHREYTLEEEDIVAQNVILKPDRTKKDANILEKSLSRRYPDLEFHEALQEEKGKLHIELQRSRTINDPNECRIIEHLIDVTENVVNAIPEKKVTKLLVNEPTYLVSGYISNANSTYGDLKPNNEKGQSEWQVDLFDCCEEPCLSLKTFIYPCGTFSRIANLVSKREISRERAVNDLMAYAIFCGCCCYTCCIRNKIRQIFDIQGGACDDFLTHLMCCCCAMVQEWRELEVRGFEGCQGRKMVPPPYQYMNYKDHSVVEHLIDVAENFVNAIPEKKVTTPLVNEPTYIVCWYISNEKSSYGYLKPEDKGQSESQVDFLIVFKSLVCNLFKSNKTHEAFVITPELVSCVVGQWSKNGERLMVGATNSLYYRVSFPANNPVIIIIIESLFLQVMKGERILVNCNTKAT